MFLLSARQSMFLKALTLAGALIVAQAFFLFLH